MTNPHFKAAAAFATYRDIWAGEIEAALVPFKTKRKGVTVTRFRWVDERGMSAGGFGSPFQTVEGALRAVQRHHEFSDVAAA